MIFIVQNKYTIQRFRPFKKVPNFELETIKGDSNLWSTQMNYIGDSSKYLGMQCTSVQEKFFHLKNLMGA